jgi:hypothetical protein
MSVLASQHTINGGPVKLTDHWHPLDGWNRHRALHAYYLTFEDQTQLHALVDAYQTQLKELTQLDPILPDWLHATVQGVGFADELPDGSAGAIAERLAHELSRMSSLSLTTGRPIAGSSGLYLRLGPSAPVARLRELVRTATWDELGTDAHDLPGQEQHKVFDPHVSFAYANDTIELQPIWERLATVQHAPVRLDLHSLSMVLLHRDDQERRWHWSDVTRLEFGRPSATRT